VYGRNYSFRMNILEEIFEIRSRIEILPPFMLGGHCRALNKALYPVAVRPA